MAATDDYELSKNARKVLPGEEFEAGIGWDEAAGFRNVDVDLHTIILYEGGRAELVGWPNKKWRRPDLGKNAQNNPYIATPEGDVLYKGDDRTGGTSQGGFDETAVFKLNKAPADVKQYLILVSMYDDRHDDVDDPMDNVHVVGARPNDPKPQPVLGWATNLFFACEDKASGERITAKLGDNHPNDVTALMISFERNTNPLSTGKWTMSNIEEGYTDDIIAIAKSLGVQLG
jgi:stress response protein SCP2